MWKLLEFSNKILTLEKTLSLYRLEFSENRWKKAWIIYGILACVRHALSCGSFYCKKQNRPNKIPCKILQVYFLLSSVYIHVCQIDMVTNRHKRSKIVCLEKRKVEKKSNRFFSMMEIDLDICIDTWHNVLTCSHWRPRCCFVNRTRAYSSSSGYVDSKQNP